MKRVLQTFAWCALAASTSAYADCDDDLERVQEHAQQLELGDEFRQTLRQLHKSAVLLAENGKADLCEEVAGAMQNMVDERERVLDRQARKRALRNAPLLISMNRIISLETLVDATVYDPEGEELGTLSAVALDPRRGTIPYVVLTYGGFLGFGKKQIPIPLDRVRMTEERGSLVLEIERDVLDEAKGLDEAPWPLRPPMPGASPAAAPR